MFVIEDEIHAEWCGEFATFQEALSELESRSKVPWDQPPNVCPCMSWRSCEREYLIIEFDISSESWRQIKRTPILNISSKGTVWEKGFEFNDLK